jgi:DNA-binding winged helix-turn-helix (wHTH) protein
VTREELYAHLWREGIHVDFEHGLNTAVRKLRRALGESPERPCFLETKPGRGYRFGAGIVPDDAGSLGASFPSASGPIGPGSASTRTSSWPGRR